MPKRNDRNSPLTEREDLKSSSRLQQPIWGFEDVDLIPLRLFVVATKIGGQVFGAFDGAHLIGFCMAIPGIKPGGKYLSAQPHAGRAERISQCGRGPLLEIGAARRALGRGIDLIEWTFDPLEIKNAFFNMERLGAIVRRYVPNQYGTTSQPAARRLAHRSLHRRVVDLEPASEAMLAGGSFERTRWKRASRFPPISRAFAPMIPRARERSSKSTSEQFRERLRSRTGCNRL